MSSITVIGGTGYAGSAIVREAASRGHDVTSFSRTAPEGDARVEGVRYETGSMTDADVRARAVSGADIVVSALSPRGELDGKIVDADLALAELATDAGVRFGVVGGFSSLRPSEGAQRFAESGELPPEYASEALQMNEVLTRLGQTPDTLDWFFASPAMQFGAYAPGESLGRYRLGGEVALFDDEGVSAVSGADFARAIVDQIEAPTVRRAQFNVAY